MTRRSSSRTRNSGSAVRLGLSPVNSWPQEQDRSLRNRCRWAARVSCCRPTHTRNTGSVSTANENLPHTAHSSRHSSRDQNRSLSCCFRASLASKSQSGNASAAELFIIDRISSPMDWGSPGPEPPKLPGGAWVTTTGARNCLLSSVRLWPRYWVKNPRNRHTPWFVQGPW